MSTAEVGEAPGVTENLLEASCSPKQRVDKDVAIQSCDDYGLSTEGADQGGITVQTNMMCGFGSTQEGFHQEQDNTSDQ